LLKDQFKKNYKRKKLILKK